MNWNDYESIWKRQPPPVGASADIAALRATFETKRRKLAATLLVRDSLEGFGGFVFALVFAGVAWRIGSRGWPILAGAVIILGISLVFLRDWWRRRRTRPGPAAPLLVRVDDELAELRHQRRLLANIGLWYFLPYLAAIAVIGSTLGRVNRGAAPPGFLLTLLTTPATLAWIVILFAVFAAAIVWAWRANRDVVKNQIDPRIVELEKLRREVQP
jgi:membrane protein implicated in regulation of membrane protease activity